MPRYIDADKLHYKRVYIEDIRNGEYHGIKSAVVVFADEIDKNKKARVSPDEVRGVGEWIEDAGGNYLVCPECKYDHALYDRLGYSCEHEYCPNCGKRLRMKGVSEDA